MAKRIDHRQRVAALEAALQDAKRERDAELAQRAATQLAQYAPHAWRRCHFDNSPKLDRSV